MQKILYFFVFVVVDFRHVLQERPGIGRVDDTVLVVVLEEGHGEEPPCEHKPVVVLGWEQKQKTQTGYFRTRRALTWTCENWQQELGTTDYHR